MSLARTALRLAAIEALRSHPTIDRLCEGRLYDSRIGDFDHREPAPVIIVTTEELAGKAFNPQNGGAPFDDACDLVLEIAHVQAVEIEGEDGLAIGRPVTDREMEAALDLIEQCAEWILTLGQPHPRARPTAAGLLLRRAVTRRVNRRTSSRFTADDTGEKLAIHLLTLGVELKGEDVDLRRPATGAFADLPDPLRTVAESLAPGSSGWLTCQMLAEQLALARDPPGPLTTGTIGPVTTPTEIPGTLPVTATLEFPQGP